MEREKGFEPSTLCLGSPWFTSVGDAALKGFDEPVALCEVGAR